MIRNVLTLLAIFSLACIAGRATAQTQTPPSPLEKQLHKMDLSINLVGIYNSTVSGDVVPVTPENHNNGPLTEFGSNTAGALVALHYVAKPYFGLEFNYGYARYTENFEGPPIVIATGLSDFQVQTKVDEYTFGYFATPPHPILGFQPFVSAGFGSTAFKPTAGGGQELPEKARATYYYSLGLQKEYGSHLAFRAGFREAFFLDPDFGQNYLTILKHATTYEPMAGFNLRY